MAVYRFPAWWGGEVESDTPPQIAGQMVALRKSVGGLKAEVKKGGPRFAIKSAKDLMDKLRRGLDELGMVAFTVAQVGGNVPLGVDEDGAAVEGTLAFLMATVRIGCSDGSFADVTGAGHGADQQDKAGGKSSTYAWKDALIKGLALPDDDMVDTDDEERPIKGGLRQKAAAPIAVTRPATPSAPGLDAVKAAIESATTREELTAAAKMAKQLQPDEQTQLIDVYNSRKADLASGG